MIRLLVWLILASLVLRSLIRLLRGIAEGLQGPPAPKAPRAVPLARDPVCGTYVVPSNALSAGAGAQTKFFCSEDCRRAYALKIAPASERRRDAAEGGRERAARWGTSGGPHRAE